MNAHWHLNTLIYQIDPSLFLDSTGDGWGDLGGIIEKLDYLQGLGIGTLWLMPIYESPWRDAGYDVTDHLALNPRFGSEAQFKALVREMKQRGMRIILELVMQHTSDLHPWFVKARQDRNSPYRDYFIWSDLPVDDGNTPIFPSVEDSIWQWDEQAGQYYRHLFYRYQPDLNLTNPNVIEEIERIMARWLALGIDGFRLDAASHMVEQAGGGKEEQGVWLLERLHAFMIRLNPQAILLGEVDVEPERFPHYLGNGQRMGLVLDFWLNNHIFLALATRQAEPLQRAIERRPQSPDNAGYAVWLRNHDELDLERLSEAEREEVMRIFAPEEDMRLYGRGIRRRLAPMLDGDVHRQLLAQALLLSLPGIPVLRYGDEIGMGDDLDLPERLAVRTPMQWSDKANAGFSSSTGKLAMPVIDQGAFAYQTLNVTAQQRIPGSMLDRVSDLLRLRANLPEVGKGRVRLLDVQHPAVFAISHGEDPVSLMLANLGSTIAEVSVDLDGFSEIIADTSYMDERATGLSINPYGYRWFRRVRTPSENQQDQ
ncbi:glycosidase [Pseudomonas daroniae]|uniref:Glycosidase n=1 Tax=Phytopseudomonas daroniae TaxID=2487519 RepID=A0A4V2KAM6_9GAMM|nr:MULTISPECIES: alpha-amylase family protein [Pseudomonas]TBU77876.1 glycosidase [Pseudomonas daroniae]TBU82223.1 glycosidase [Pseudomonas sp. FRB 228]TBU91149.1 glycosidase [Pseudomonas daroniae]